MRNMHQLRTSETMTTALQDRYIYADKKIGHSTVTTGHLYSLVLLQQNSPQEFLLNTQMLASLRDF